MGGLNVHADDESSVSQSQKKKWFKSPKVIFGVGVLIAIPVVGTTLATTNQIQVNGNRSIAFGQGNAAALACDESVTITPKAVFKNNTWFLESVTISDLDTTAGLPNCHGKTITLGAYNESNNTIASSETTFTLDDATSPWYTGLQSSTWAGILDTLTVTDIGSDNTKIKITYSDNDSNVGVDVNALSPALTGFTIQQQG